MSFSATSDDRPSWSDLPIDLWVKIATNLTSILDVGRFALVCPTWKVVSYVNKHHPSKRFPWILLSEKDRTIEYSIYSDPKSGCRSFRTSFHSCRIFPDPVSFPLATACGRRCLGSGAGWLLMLSTDGQIHMISPFTGARVPLPPQSTMKFGWHPRDPPPEQKFKAYISKIVVGKDKSGCLVAVAIAGSLKRLAIARPRDRKWKTMRCKWSPIADAIFHEGHIYAVSAKGTLVTCNTADQAERIAYPPEYKVTKLHDWYILVSIYGSLLLVAREYSWREATKSFTVFELLREQWMRVMDLGDQALFVGLNTSVSVKASRIPDCQANCVYFTDDCMKVYLEDEYGGGADTGKYSLEDGSLVLSDYVGESLYSPPLWYLPDAPYDKFK